MARNRNDYTAMVRDLFEHPADTRIVWRKPLSKRTAGEAAAIAGALRGHIARSNALTGEPVGHGSSEPRSDGRAWSHSDRAAGEAHVVGRWSMNRPTSGTIIHDGEPTLCRPVSLEHDGVLWLVNAAIFGPRGYVLDCDPRTNGFMILGDGTEPYAFDGSDAGFRSRLDQIAPGLSTAVAQLVDCVTCHGKPPVGFACRTCGQQG